MAVAENATGCSFTRSTYATPGSVCYVNPIISGEKDAVAVVRLVASILSIIGSASVVLLVVTKRKICSAKIQPILLLSVADCLLAMMWIVGSVAWLNKAPSWSHGGWCIGVLVLTAVFELVTVNMTLVYALVAHAVYRHHAAGSTSSLMGSFKRDVNIWHPFKTGVAYSFAWFEPVFVVLVMFGIFEFSTRIVEQVEECSCWCVPFYGNVIPTPPISSSVATEDYFSNLRKFVLTISVIIAIHYLLVFVLLTTIYVRIVLLVRAEHRKCDAIQSSPCSLQYKTLSDTGNSAVAKTVLLFLALFVVTGASNLALSLYSVGINSDPKGHYRHLMPSSPFLVLSLLQSLVLPLQGFLNAIVYGWTNEDFVDAVVKSGTVSWRRGSYSHLDQSTSDLKSEEVSEPD